MNKFYIGGRTKGYESTEQAYLSHLESSRDLANRKDTKRIMKNNLELAKLDEENSLDKANMDTIS